jgi:hypothetical protein
VNGLRRGVRVGIALGIGTAFLLVAPGVALAHSLSGRVDTPLPFIAYVGGAAIAVALSFFFVAVSDPGPPQDAHPDRVIRVPRWLWIVLRAMGLIGWLWIVVQSIVSTGSSDADVAYLFLWIYGWVGLAVISAVVGPFWSAIDPFSTLHDIGSALFRRLGVSGLEPRPWPEQLRTWPALAGLCFFIWLELVVHANGGQLLAFTMIGYTVVTLVGMAQYGKVEWRRHGEAFSVWFGLLGRLAPFATVGEPEERLLHRRPYGTGLVMSSWSVDRVAMVAVSTAGIIYDGASQTRPFYDTFGFPDILSGTILLFGFLGIVTAAVLAVGRRVGMAGIGAGLVPVALGYLIAHYLTAFLQDSQRILVVLSDPFQQGWNLIGFVTYQGNTGWLSTGVLWGIQVAAVVIGHVIGAWAGHAAARGDSTGREKVGLKPAPKAARAPKAAPSRAEPASERGRSGTPAPSQVPLALLMIGLTSLTLWSLGQNLVFIPTGSG